MKILTIYGISDDLIECSGIPGANEFDIGQFGDVKDNDIGYVGTFHLVEDANAQNEGGNSAMAIHCFYGFKGTWYFAPAQIDDGIRIPNWKITIYPDKKSEYSTFLNIEVPDNVSLRIDKK